MSFQSHQFHEEYIVFFVASLFQKGRCCDINTIGTERKKLHHRLRKLIGPAG